MNSLIKGIAELPRRYAKVLFAKLGALLILFALLILMTMFMAFVMVNQWHFSEWLTASLCFAPWVVALVVFIGLASINTARFEREKQDLYDLGRQQLMIQGAALLLNFFKKRKSKAEHAADEAESS
jgi:hypothetical protein